MHRHPEPSRNAYQELPLKDVAYPYEEVNFSQLLDQQKSAGCIWGL
jgi:hypothetical protein